jgi:hypothetical protein
VLRESIAVDSDLAVESARAQRRTRRANVDDPSETLQIGYRDPGYSQAVRRTCQQRLVQLIPIRPGALALVLTIMWAVWGSLLLAHYLCHVRGNDSGRSGLLILQLFDIRSPHSIANWMTCQLWTLTAIVSWMIFRIRQHKLDDYRAKYRIWIFLAGVALFSSFDAATSALYLLGQSIDGWTRKEIGYGGWPLVLASYASLIALMALKLSNELKATPMAVVFWFGGLLSWACAALLGTGLLKLQWQQGTIDLVVGGCWLGGVLLVFQSAGVFLRHCYLHAQKRFVERAIAASPGLRFEMPAMPSMPRMPWSRSKDATNESDDLEEGEDDDDVLGTIPKKAWLPWRTQATPKQETEPKRPMRLLGIIPSRAEANEMLAVDPIEEDNGGPVDTGLTKKPGWFGLGGHKQTENIDTAPRSSSTKPVPKPEAPSTQSTPTSVKEKRRWLPNLRSTKNAESAKVEPAKKTSAATAAPSSTTASAPSPSAKSWLPFRKNKPAAEPKPAAKAEAKPVEAPKKKPAASTDEKIVKRLSGKIFGWLDGLKLKPPVDDAPVARSNAAVQTPSTSSAPKPVATSNAPFPSTSPKPSIPQAQDDEDEMGANEHRHLSKAERKRLRRQQGNDRNAA